MAMWQIPLIEGSQRFSVTLGENVFQLSLIYRTAPQGGWFLDLEKTDGSDAIYGIPLVLNANLLSQHQYKGWGSLYVQMDGDVSTHPSYENMGKNVLLLWSDE